MLKRFLILIMLTFYAFPVLAASLSQTEQMQVVNAAAMLIEQRYVDMAKGKDIARQLRRSSERWKTPAEPVDFAKRMTQWLRSLSADGHFQVDYSEALLPEDGGEDIFSAQELKKFYGAQLNYGIEKIERLADNIMLLELHVFPPPDMAGDVFAAAMTAVAQGDALIIDLRNNGGGMDTTNLLIGYLVDAGSPLSGVYDRPTDRTIAQTSPSWVPGRRFGSTKPLYILTGHKTFSAAEAVAYDLQALKRATIVGETTGGGANPFEYRRITAHFALSLPEQRSVNPITGTNWQGVGVKPDVIVPADQALDKALELARLTLSKEQKATP